MLHLCLKNGERKWVTKNEARLLQKKGKVVCVLDIKDDSIDYENDLNFYSIGDNYYEAVPSAC